MSAEETTPNAHILVVDDDREIRDLLARFLKKYNYRVSAAANGKEMAKVLSQWSIDLVVLDIMMPGEDGLSLCRSLREKSNVAIIMLTMMNEETDRIVGLEMGADDYLTKPFNPRELMARIKAVLRRTNSMPAGNANSRADILNFAGFKLDIGRRQLFSPDDLLIDLSSGEFDLLFALAEHSQKLLTRDQLLDITSGRAEAPFDRSIDMQISRLRRKIETGNKGEELIKTIRGAGYMLTEAATRQNGSS
ncbi:MAG: response regulator [Devosiaceae bacterium]|nr:response regulator [Devosiaceae bacterium]